MPAEKRYTITLTDSTHRQLSRERVLYRDDDQEACDAAARELRRWNNTHPDGPAYDGWRVTTKQPPLWTLHIVAEVRPGYDSRTPKTVPGDNPHGFPF